MNLLTDTQKRAAQAIVNIFETGSVRGDYGKVTLIPGDTGQLTYGRSQTTLTSGNLFELIDAYCRRPGACFGAALSSFLPALEAKDPKVNDNSHLHNLLQASADDVVMRDTQDEFFDAKYWATAVRLARREGVTTPLGAAVVYDSVIHGSWPRICREVQEERGTVAAAGEKVWMAAYVRTRHRWLAHHKRGDLRKTVYRMDAFNKLMEQEAWMLELPLVVRQLEINGASLFAPPSYVYDGPVPRSREILFTSPLLRGLDVRLVQLALSGAGHVLVADGIYGRASKGIMEAFQRANALAVTGTISSADFEALGL